MRRVRIYIEGNSKKYNNELREGFRAFLSGLRDCIKPEWDALVIMCGSRWDAFDDFKTANTLYKDDICVLLIDAEWPVKKDSPWQHLAEKETWDMTGYDDNCCYLMVQTTEAWFFADIDTVAMYYKQGFNRNSMGNTQDIENIPKQELYSRLANATKDTQKGKYNKGNHTGALLRKINPELVRKSSPHCDRIFTEIPKLVQR